MLRLLLGCVASFFIFFGCNKAKPNDNPTLKVTESSSIRDSESLPSEEVLGIPGYIIRCKESLVSDRQRELNCGVSDEAEKMIDFENEIESFDYRLDSIYSDLFTQRQTDDPFYPIGLSLDATLKPDVAVFSIYLSTRLIISAKYIDPSKPAIIVSELISSSVADTSPVLFNYLRIYIDSVEDSQFDSPTACLSNLVLYDKGLPLENTVDLAGDHFIGSNKVNATASTFVDVNVDPYHALIGDGVRWESEFNVFSNVSPFDTVGETWYQLEFPNSKPNISAIRFTSLIPEYPLGECIPDKIRISASDDGINWTELHAIELVAPSAQSLIYIKWK